VVLMVGGNIPGATETISIVIYDNVQALNYSAANHMVMLLLTFAFVALSVTYALNRRVWAVWPLHR
jgi:molybdate transport system permease protein